MHSRKIVGYDLSDSLELKGCVRALNKALYQAKTIKGLIHHSDRGIQYACKEFANYLGRNELVTRSISRKGDCWDNAVAESFFKSLKTELIYHQDYSTRKQAELAVLAIQSYRFFL